MRLTGIYALFRPARLSMARLLRAEPKNERKSMLLIWRLWMSEAFVAARVARQTERGEKLCV